MASWIGSLQLFLMYAPGVLVGRAFDGGYLYVYSILEYDLLLTEAAAVVIT